MCRFPILFVCLYQTDGAHRIGGRHSLYLNLLYRLLLALVERVRCIYSLCEVYFAQIDTTYCIVVGCLIVYAACCKIYCRGPLCSARKLLLVWIFDGYRYIKVVENMEAFQHCIYARSALRRTITEECSSYKT